MSQMASSLVIQLNTLVEKGDVEPIIFFQEYGKTVTQPNFALMQQQNIWDFTGTIITTSPLFVETIENCPAAQQRFFYPFDLHWIYKQIDYKSLRTIYQNDNVELIARSQWHYDILSIWKKPQLIINDFDNEELYKLCQLTNQN